MGAPDELDQRSRELLAGIRGGDRALLSQAITLVESSRPEHRTATRQLLSALADTGIAQESGNQSPGLTVRVGISGVPGVGKSTFIDALGTMLTSAGHRVGVLAVDPSSTRTGGSVLGDKTRMSRLAADPHAYIRPSPAAGTLGGVARATAQTLVLLEAAGYDVVLIETVGVGQSEVTVAGMVDTFCFLTLARTGDQLQGIKKGIVELADVIAVNKADGGREAESAAAARDLGGALRLVRGSAGAPKVVTCSALTETGIDEVWTQVLAHRAALGAQGLVAKRAAQQVDFTWALVRETLELRLRHSAGVARIRDEVTSDVLAGNLSAIEAADRLISAFDDSLPTDP
jgi:LAO/AO transport system kinase